jgi:hypothetical protein
VISRSGPILAGLLAALTVALCVLFLVLGSGVGRVSTASLDTGDWTDEVPYVLVNVATVLVGAVLAAKRPRNPIGWLLTLLGLGFVTYPVVVLVVAAALRDGADASLWVRLVAWVGNWIWVFGHAGVVFLLLLFPTGRPVSRRWRPVVWFAAAVIGALLFVAATLGGPLEAAPRLDNPFGLPTPRFFVMVLIAMILALEVLGCASLVVRFFRSRGVERQQIKWVAFGAAILAVYLLTNILFPVPRWIDALAPAVMVAAITIAVLRHRLYDIDVVINRTLVYGSLTATLAATYFGGVVLLQGAFRALTGQESQLAVVASTLLIAVLFGPLRRRMQALIDRRFYRRKYDAVRTLQDFSAKLREETDLDRLGDELLSVVQGTMQPAHVSLWLRPAVEPDREKAAEQSR